MKICSSSCSFSYRSPAYQTSRPTQAHVCSTGKVSHQWWAYIWTSFISGIEGALSGSRGEERERNSSELCSARTRFHYSSRTAGTQRFCDSPASGSNLRGASQPHQQREDQRKSRRPKRRREAFPRRPTDVHLAWTRDSPGDCMTEGVFLIRAALRGDLHYECRYEAPHLSHS
ncbi:hypothetical protein MHYP_G00252170 [Metynnis hypsauchen]